MKALSLHQPWASLVASGVKTIETRSWRAPVSLIGERLAVHATARRSASSSLPCGAVVAVCTVAGCVPMLDAGGESDEPAVLLVDGRLRLSPCGVDVEPQRQYGDFRAGRWAWLLADVEAFRVFYAAKGRRGLWDWHGPGAPL